MRLLTLLALLVLLAAAPLPAQRLDSAVLTRKFSEFGALHEAKRYGEARALCLEVAEGAEALDHRRPDLDIRELSMWARYNAACCAALMGDLKDAREQLLLSVDSGFSDPDGMQEDADLAQVLVDPAAIATIAARIEARERELARRSPAFLLVLPAGVAAETRLPVIVALHGAGGSPSGWRDYWQQVADGTGRAVVLGRGSIEEAPGAFYWNRFWWKHEARRIAGWLEEARRREPRLDTSRAMITGFSQGGGHAAAIGLLDEFPWEGILVIGPYIQVNHRKRMEEPGRLKKRPVVVTLGSAEEEGVAGSADFLRKLPPPGAIVHVVPGRGHELPPAAETIGLVKELSRLAK